MPIRASERARYPKDWPAIRARILARAEGRCEFLMANGARCDAPDLELVFRDRQNPEYWRFPHGGDCGEADPDCYGVKIVLTVAHLNHQPEDCRDENLRAGCQLHHLRHDKAHHQQNAAWTRRAHKRNGELFEGSAMKEAAVIPPLQHVEACPICENPFFGTSPKDAQRQLAEHIKVADHRRVPTQYEREFDRRVPVVQAKDVA